MRVAGVLFCALCLVGEQPDWAKAHTALQAYIEARNKSLPEDQQQHIYSHDYNYLRTWWARFRLWGSVHDAARSGRPTIIPDADALKAASLVKEGRWVEKKVKGKTVKHLVHYTSISQAVRVNEELRNMVARLGVSPEQLLHAMHEVDPDLVRRKIFFKHSFTPDELGQRMRFATFCLGMQQVSGHLLSNTIFIDESSIVINKHTKSDVYVWCDKHDLNFSDVCPRKLPKEGSVTVRFIVAVSAHPAFSARGGLVYMDFTTGTTNINRRVNRRYDGSQRVGDWRYQVSRLHLPDSAVAI